MFNLFGNALNAISRQNSVVSSFARDYNEEGINLIDQKNEMHAQQRVLDHNRTLANNMINNNDSLQSDAQSHIKNTQQKLGQSAAA